MLSMTSSRTGQAVRRSRTIISLLLGSWALIGGSVVAILLIERTLWNQGVYDVHSTTSTLSNGAIAGAICADIGILSGILALLAVVQRMLPALQEADRRIDAYIAIVCGSVALIFCWVPVFPLVVALPAAVAGSVGVLRSRRRSETRILSRTGLTLAGMAIASALLTTLLETS